jgi:hypothetical protein
VRVLTGRQLDEVLVELDRLSTWGPEGDEPLGGNLISEEDFIRISLKYGAGKDGGHHKIYSRISLNPAVPSLIVEVGIGTNNPKLASNMGVSGMPGASLRMWTEIFPNSHVIGADIDRSILVTEPRIETFWVDQQSEGALEEFLEKIEELGGASLIIDDGLHTPEANLRTFRILHKALVPGGYYVVEDIERSWAGFWSTLGKSLQGFESQFLVVPEKDHSADGFFVLRKKL